MSVNSKTDRTGSLWSIEGAHMDALGRHHFSDLSPGKQTKENPLSPADEVLRSDSRPVQLLVFHYGKQVLFTVVEITLLYIMSVAKYVL